MDDNIIRLWKSPAGYAEGIQKLFSKPNRLIKAKVVHQTSEVMEVLSQAELEAETIILDARESAKKIEDKAHEEGVQKGYKEVAQNLIKAKNEYSIAKKNTQSDAVEFAFQIAERIIGQSLEKNPSLISSIVAQVLSQCVDQKSIVVLAHPKDLSLLREEKHILLQATDQNPVQLEASDRVERGECIIETADGRIDGRLSVQLNALKSALLEPS